MLWTWVERYAIADAYSGMSDKAWKMPMALRVFYGFNFIIAIIFLLPLGAPILALAGGYFIGLLLFGIEEGESQISRRSIKFTTFLYGIFALVIGLIFYANILELFTNLFNVWVGSLPTLIFPSARNLADAVAIGSVIYIFFEIRSQRELYAEIPERLVTIVSIGTFIILEVPLLFIVGSSVDINQANLAFFDLIHWIIVIITVIVVVAKFFMVASDEASSSMFSWFSLLVFQLVGVFERGAAQILESAAIFMAFMIFAVLFVASYYQAKQRF
jgi:hypothetical protein